MIVKELLISLIGDSTPVIDGVGLKVVDNEVESTLLSDLFVKLSRESFV